MRKIIPFIIILALTAYFLPSLLVRLSLYFAKQEAATSNSEQEEERTVFPPIFEETAKATNSANLKVSGYSQEGGQVEIFVNNISKEIVKVKENGRFEIELKLYEGENAIYGVSYNKNKQKSAASKEITVLYKKTKPKLVVDNPIEERSSSSKRNIKISGKTDLEGTLRVNGRWVMVKDDGSFVFEANLNDGENKFEITAEDLAGNSETVSKTIVYAPN